MSENINNVYIDLIDFQIDIPLTFENVRKYFSDYHYESCCEQHYLDWDYIKDFLPTAVSVVPEFNKVEIKGTPEMGITLFFINWDNRFGIFVPWYAINNGYYSDELTLKVTLPSWWKREYDITSYQTDN